MTYLLRRLLFLVAALLPVALPYIPALAQTTETLIFIHTDIAGSVIGQTNAAGNLFWRENYRPYGERTVNSPSAAGNREFFHGKAFDVDTELNYVGARYYDPVVGRFMGVDAVGFDERNIHSFNRFAYGNNNPYKFVDPDGRAPFLILFAPVIASVGGAVIAGSLSAGIQYGTTGTIQWGGIGGVLDAMGEGATLGLLGVSAFGQARTAVVAGATIGVGRTAAFDIAREGGKHSGLYREYTRRSTREVEKAVSSYERQVVTHQDKLANPEKYVANWSKMDPREQKGLVRHWEQDLKRNQDAGDIMRGILRERGIGDE